MTAELYCFVNIMIATYGTICIIVRRKIAYRGMTFVPNKIFNFYYFHSSQYIQVLLGSTRAHCTKCGSPARWLKNIETMAEELRLKSRTELISQPEFLFKSQKAGGCNTLAEVLVFWRTGKRFGES
jgi:hypothetical protein